MAAGDAPATLAELRTDFLEKLKETTGVSAVNTVVARFLNQANQDIHMENWWWKERRAVIITKPPYTTGTVTVNQGATAVTGTGTAWTTNDAFGNAQAAAGEKMVISSITDVNLITTVGSATNITLTDRFAGEDQSDVSYAIYQDEYALASDFDDVVDVRFFNEDRTIRLIGAQEFYRHFTRNTIRQGPKWATLVELGPSGSASLRRRVVFGPAPDQAYQIPYRYWTTNLAVSSTGTAAANLSADTDEPIIPIRFRQALVWKALELWFASRQKNQQLARLFGGFYAALILRARAAKGPTQDRLRLVPDTARYWDHVKSPYRPVSPRLTTGPEWDELKY